MKILTNRRYNEMEQEFVELQLDLQHAKDDNEIYQIQVETLNNKIKNGESKLKARIAELEASLIELQNDISSKNNEIKKLKNLLIRNKVSYKKTTKAEKKCKKTK